LENSQHLPSIQERKALKIIDPFSQHPFFPKHGAHPFHNIMSHLNSNNILIENLHGFRAGHLCATQLVTLTEDILHTLDRKKQIDITLLDFAKLLIQYHINDYLSYNTIALEMILLTG